MFNFGSTKKDLLGLLTSERTLRSSALVVEPSGPHAVRIVKDGAVKGVWRQMGKSYAYYPSGHFQPLHQTSTPEEAVALTVRLVGGNG